MRLSVVTVTYNLIDAGRLEFFRQAVESVRRQSHADTEHIVIDGASDDGTRDVLSEMAASGAFEHYVSEPDEGAYDAMNRGAARATGDYLLFLNSDDFYHRPDALALVARAAGTRPEFVAASVVMEGPSGPRLAGVSRFFQRVLITMPFSHQGLAMRRDVFEALGGFDLRFRIAADYDLVLRMFLSGARGETVGEPVATFREGGLSSDAEARAAEYVAIWRKNYPSPEAVAARDWREAASRRTLPRPVLKAIVRDRAIPRRLRLIATWHLLRGK